MMSRTKEIDDWYIDLDTRWVFKVIGLAQPAPIHHPLTLYSIIPRNMLQKTTAKKCVYFTEGCSGLGLSMLARRELSLAQIDMGRAAGTYCNISLTNTNTQ
jgi:hypothetical protein